MAANIATVASPIPLQVTQTNFFSFATPAVSVPFPSAYAQTQIPFVYPAKPTWAATRIPTTIGGVAATSGISSALRATGINYGQSGTNSNSKSHGSWPTWATAVIAVCGGIAIIVLSFGVFCWCTRGKRAAKRDARGSRTAPLVGRKKSNRVTTEKHVGGGAAMASGGGGGGGSGSGGKAGGRLHRERKSGSTTLAGLNADPNFYGIKNQHGSGRSSSPRGQQPYPPHPASSLLPAKDPYGRILDPAAATYPLVGEHHYQHNQNSDGYATPEYAQDGYDSPQRLWVPSAPGSSAGGDSTSRGSYHDDQGRDLDVPRTLPLRLSRSQQSHNPPSPQRQPPQQPHYEGDYRQSTMSAEDDDWAPPDAGRRAAALRQQQEQQYQHAGQQYRERDHDDAASSSGGILGSPGYLDHVVANAGR
ncbi:hypothetical protein RQP46_007582 [Phenoliferia psychrophenolica]